MCTNQMLPDRYTIANIRRAVNQPQLLVEEVGRLPFTAHALIQNGYANLNGYGESDSITLVEEDWDNLVVIDACRADLFEETVDTDRYDNYRRVISKDTNTTPWSIKNFKNKALGDTVFVTGNPATSKTVPTEFHRFIETWTDPGAHDANSYTVPPGPVCAEARDASAEYPHKRLIVHLVQPHAPFVPRPDLIYRTYWSEADRVGVDVGEPDTESPDSIWEALESGLVKRKSVWKGYQENLEYVMRPVHDLVADLPGKTIITSDHGNMLGERTVSGRRVYGHPGGIRTQALVEVPWAVIDSDDRKIIRDGGVQSEGSMESEIITQRLAALGYVE